MKIKTYGGRNRLLFAAAALLFLGASLLPGTAAADHFNRISEVAIPALVIAFALIYPALAFVPALLVHLIMRFAFKRRGAFKFTYLLALAGGELGIGACVGFSALFSEPHVWNSYHYTVYPWIISGLALAGAFLGHRIRREKLL